MSENANSPLASVRHKVESIIAGGGDVRGQVSTLVAEAASTVQKSGVGLVALAQSVVNASSDALNKGISSVSPEGTLRQVIDGLGDGLSQAALSAKMAVEEARSQGKQFAAEDLRRMKDDLGSLTSLYVQTIGDAVSRTRGEASMGFSGLMEHAEKARERMLPAFQSALEAVRQDPVGLGKESVHAGIVATRHVAGSLFTTMGQLLQHAGRRLSPGPKDS